MKKPVHPFLCIFLLWGSFFVNISDAQTIFQIVHFPITEAPAGKEISIKATYDGNLKSEIFYIYYRTVGDPSFQHDEMQPDLDGWIGQIPAGVVREPGVEYFISAVTQTKQVVTSPPQNPYNVPYKVSITKAAATPLRKKSVPDSVTSAEKTEMTSNGTVAPDFLILSPEKGQIFLSDEVVVAISYIGPSQNINWKSVRIYLNRTNITKQGRGSQGVISFMPQTLAAGNYQFILRYKDQAGKKQPDLAINFTVIDNQAGKATREASDEERNYKGNVYFDLKQEKISEKKLETNQIGGNLYGRFNSIKYRGKFFFTSREEKTSQPRNRFYFGIENNWLGCQFGDTNPYFNDLMLYGKRVRGFSAYIKTGLLNVEFVTGETRRAVNGVAYSDFVLNPATGDTLYYNPNSVPPDTVNDGNVTEFTTRPPGYEYVYGNAVSQYGTYQQLLTGVRPSFGRGDHFKLAFTYLKAKDQVSSIDMGLRPNDNVVIGSDILLAFDDHRFEIQSGVAFSLLTQDISKGTYTKTQLDSAFNVDFPFDPSQYEKYLVLNETTNPLDPTGLSSLAYNAKIKLNYMNNSFQVLYKSIGPEYNSLGNTFLKKDIRGFNVIDRLRIIKNRLILNLDYSRYDDNFFPDEIPTTVIRTMNTGISLFLPEQYPKITFSYRTQDRDNRISVVPQASGYDSRIKNKNSDLSFIMSYDFTFSEIKNNFSFSWMKTARTDGFDRTMFNIDTDLLMFSLFSKYQIPLRTTVGFATTRNNSGEGESKFIYNMLDLKGEYLFLDEKLDCFVGIKNISAKNEYLNGADLEFDRFCVQAGTTVQIKEMHSIMFNGYIIHYSDNMDRSFNDQIFQLRYDFRF